MMSDAVQVCVWCGMRLCMHMSAQRCNNTCTAVQPPLTCMLLSSLREDLPMQVHGTPKAVALAVVVEGGGKGNEESVDHPHPLQTVVVCALAHVLRDMHLVHTKCLCGGCSGPLSGAEEASNNKHVERSRGCADTCKFFMWWYCCTCMHGHAPCLVALGEL